MTYTRLRSISLFLSIIVLPLPVYAAPPLWWSERGVTNANPADDYAAANIGKLKHIASKARTELNDNLPDGAGNVINSLLSSWQNPPVGDVVRDDYITLTLGQLKAVAQPFYFRLIQAGYTTVYPWTNSQNAPDNSAIANIGQLKQVFSFDVTTVDAAHDTDGNGLPDWWERFYFGNIGVTASELAARGGGLTILQAFQQRLNPMNAFSGQTPVLQIASGENQKIAPTMRTNAPLIVRMIGAQSGLPLSHAPVHFSIVSGAGLLNSENVLTNSSGLAMTYFTAPAEDGSILIEATTGSSNHPTVSLSVESISPAAPSNLSATVIPPNFYNPSGGITLHWHDNAITETAYIIEKQNPDGTWTEVGEVPPNTTEFEFYYGAPDES